MLAAYPRLAHHKMKKFTLFLSIFSLFPVFVFAAVTQPKNFSEFVMIVVGIIKLLIPVVAALALLTFFWGMAKFISAAGDEKAIADGKNIMIWGVIAVFVMVSIWGIISLLSGSFGFDFGIPKLPDGSYQGDVNISTDLLPT